MTKLELWGGPEITVNRVGEVFRDQIKESGHFHRDDDLDLFAELGLSAIRYPVLWEQVAPDRPDRCDWDWADRRLVRLRALGVRPIVSLVHHGSGPRYTNLLADDFATGLAAHAGRVAERHPWIAAWTPVNEPLTTARFSALYGHWYPHHRDERSFWLALLNQVDATRLAMAAVRRVNPAAELVQTDDLGRTFATPPMRDQAAFDNSRRWMGWDLLCGRVTPGHDFWARLCGHGFEDRLRAIADAPCPPDIVGVNHYLTSDRFLDHRVRRYDRPLRGTNGHARFADTEAVRVLDPTPPGLKGVLREAWNRYRIPLAVTEVHNGSTREEQMRWMVEAFATARDLRADGVDVRAVTAWALLGSYGWDRLLTDRGRYEPGVFDLADGGVRPTAMVPVLKALAAGEAPALPGGRTGWWRRPIRIAHPVVPRPAPVAEQRRSVAEEAAPVLLVGDDTDGLAGCCHRRGLRFRRSAGQVPADALLDGDRPWSVVMERPGDGRMAAACAARGLPVALRPDDPAQWDGMFDQLIDAAGVPPASRSNSTASCAQKMRTSAA